MSQRIQSRAHPVDGLRPANEFVAMKKMMVCLVSPMTTAASGLGVGEIIGGDYITQRERGKG